MSVPLFTQEITLILGKILFIQNHSSSVEFGCGKGFSASICLICFLAWMNLIKKVQIPPSAEINTTILNGLTSMWSKIPGNCPHE